MPDPADLVRAAAGLLGPQPCEGTAIAPGRVDLLGSHTDYNGLPVLAAAIDRYVAAAFRRRNDRRVRLRNADSRFPPREFELRPSIPPAPAGDWSNYVRAAAAWIVNSHPDDRVSGMDIGVAASLPARGGLSSSSALVVASALSLGFGTDLLDDPLRLAEQLAEAEHYVGTRGGGMDQAAILCGVDGHALEIDFDPLRIRPRRFPEDVSLVLCHSLVDASKSREARDAYNRRVVECRIAAAWLALETGRDPRIGNRWIRLGDLVEADPIEEWAARLREILPPDPVSAETVRRRLGPGLPWPGIDAGLPETADERFSLLKRARHVLTEAARVRRGSLALERGDVAALAECMNLSHASTRDDFETSCPAVERLVEILRSHGAPAARMCGAGFGGQVAALVPPDNVPSLRDAVRRLHAEPAGAPVGEIFHTIRPAPGATVR